MVLSKFGQSGSNVYRSTHRLFLSVLKREQRFEFVRISGSTEFCKSTVLAPSADGQQQNFAFLAKNLKLIEQQFFDIMQS